MLTPVGATESSNLSYQWLYILLPKRWVLDYPPRVLYAKKTLPVQLSLFNSFLYSTHTTSLLPPPTYQKASYSPPRTNVSNARA